MRCPVCKADNAQGPQCRRCKADLTVLFDLEAARRARLDAARGHLGLGHDLPRRRHRDLLARLGLLDGDLPGLVGNGGGGEWVGGGGGGAPVHGVEEGVELVGRAEAGRLGQGDLLDDLGPRLDLPYDLQFFAQAVVLDRREGEQVLLAADGGLERRRREGAGAHVVDDPLPGADADQLALFMRGGEPRRSWGSPRRGDSPLRPLAVRLGKRASARNRLTVPGLRGRFKHRGECAMDPQPRTR
jgi:hypothetical protein